MSLFNLVQEGLFNFVAQGRLDMHFVRKVEALTESDFEPHRVVAALRRRISPKKILAPVSKLVKRHMSHVLWETGLEWAPVHQLKLHESIHLRGPTTGHALPNPLLRPLSVTDSEPSCNLHRKACEDCHDKNPSRSRSFSPREQDKSRKHRRCHKASEREQSGKSSDEYVDWRYWRLGRWWTSLSRDGHREQNVSWRIYGNPLFRKGRIQYGVGLQDLQPRWYLAEVWWPGGQERCHVCATPRDTDSIAAACLDGPHIHQWIFAGG